MWLVVIMVVAVALIIGPFMMMRPNPAQKRKEQLRINAAAKGIRFSVKTLPQQNTEIEKSAPIPVYFLAPGKHARDDDWLLLRAGYTHEMHFLNSWAWQGESRASSLEQSVLQKYLPLLPESVEAVSAGSKGVCVYWREQGGEQVLEQIIALLTELKNLQGE